MNANSVSKVVPFRPVLHFPRMVIWHNGDQKNPSRGNWFYRDAEGGLYGPFPSKQWARHDMVNRATGTAVPMRTPFERDGMWWWKQDTANGPKVTGPYPSQRLCDLAIQQHIQALKDNQDVYR